MRCRKHHWFILPSPIESLGHFLAEGPPRVQGHPPQEVGARACTSLYQRRAAEFLQDGRKRDFDEKVSDAFTARSHLIPYKGICRFRQDLVFNMDETWVYVDRRKMRVIVPHDWPEAPSIDFPCISYHITLVMCICADSTYLPTTAILPLQYFPADLSPFSQLLCWSGSITGWINSDIYEQWVEQVLIPHIQAKRAMKGIETEPALIWLDGHSTRESAIARERLAAANVFCLTIPAHTSHALQPLDCGVHRSFKEQLKTYYRRPKDGGVGELRDALIEATIRAKHRAQDPVEILASFERTGLSPWNPNRILGDPTKVAKIADEGRNVPTAARRSSISGRVLVNPDTVAAAVLDMATAAALSIRSGQPHENTIV
jgi:hypothetical protein